MSPELVEEQEEQADAILPLCEANRDLVTQADVYASNVVSTVGPLRFIDKRPRVCRKKSSGETAN